MALVTYMSEFGGECYIQRFTILGHYGRFLFSYILCVMSVE
jgi:hypothetical protein